MVSVFIPTIGRSPVLVELILSLAADPIVRRITIGDNGMEPDQLALIEAACDRIFYAEVTDQRGVGLYAMWNQAITEADGHLAILNDDVRIPMGMVSCLALAALAHDLTLVCPDYALTDPHLSLHVELVQGTYRDGGVCGFAFLVDADRCPLIDERFRIWYGDDDLVWKIREQGGRVGILRGLPVEHLGSLSVNSSDWVPAAQAEDAALWQSLGRGAA